LSPMGQEAVQRDTLIAAQLINHSLPPSLTLSTAEEADRVGKLTQRTKRALLVDCRAAWRAAGVVTPRGRRLPPPDRFLPALDIFMAFGKATLAAGDDRDAANEAVQTAADELQALKTALARMDARALAANQTLETA
jgi:hypothetical protein